MQLQPGGAVKGLTEHATWQLGTPAGAAGAAGGGAAGCGTAGAGCVCGTGAGVGVPVCPAGALQLQPAGAVNGFTRQATAQLG
jgi:hypothetical protein